ncbi:hypothetical protein DFJ68_1971 [Terracoccus luteus]|uniref:DUF2071 domain-containing protein n=2 Tax=Terracoccus luteus TaxID=53356 RepID=A0A495Y071_9MICO|nr:hypothetical protein DFJ68_1971 [Terracoccus luteus]
MSPATPRRRSWLRRPAPDHVPSSAPPLTGPIMMNQDWLDLTFIHWAVDPSEVERFMPPGARPDVRDGRTYVGLIPFRMVGAGVGRGPGVPWAGTFLETNVRLYAVDADGRRGIVFLSLDTDRSVIVAGARAAFGLPYRWAHMRHTVEPDLTGRDVHHYEARLRRRGAPVTSRIGIRVGDPREATELDHYLGDRWGLYVRHLGRTLYVPNVHGAWPVRDAEVVELDDDLVRSVGLGNLADRTPDHVAFSPGVHTEFGLPARA